jgi:anti-sigma factor ChrR (cupin superfamily)
VHRVSLTRAIRMKLELHVIYKHCRKIVHLMHSDRGDILETNIGEPAVHAGIESITALLAGGAEAPGGDRLRAARWLSPMKQSSEITLLLYTTCEK